MRVKRIEKARRRQRACEGDRFQSFSLGGLAHGLAAFAAKFHGLRKLRAAVRTDMVRRLFDGSFCRYGHPGAASQDLLHLRQNAGQLSLQIELSALVILFGELADAKLELQIAQALVNARFLLLEML